MTMPPSLTSEIEGATAGAHRVSRSSEKTAATPCPDCILLDAELVQLGELESGGTRSVGRFGFCGLALGGGSLGHAGLISRGRDRLIDGHTNVLRVIIRL